MYVKNQLSSFLSFLLSLTRVRLHVVPHLFHLFFVSHTYIHEIRQHGILIDWVINYLIDASLYMLIIAVNHIIHFDHFFFDKKKTFKLIPPLFFSLISINPSLYYIYSERENLETVGHCYTVVVFPLIFILILSIPGSALPFVVFSRQKKKAKEKSSNECL